MRGEFSPKMEEEGQIIEKNKSVWPNGSSGEDDSGFRSGSDPED